MTDKWLTPKQIAQLKVEDERLRNQLGTAYDCQDITNRLLDHIEADNKKVKIFVKRLMSKHIWNILKRLQVGVEIEHEFALYLVRSEERDTLAAFLNENPRPYWEDDET
jgi:hypothetical protein